jgi:hypothetical protein
MAMLSEMLAAKKGTKEVILIARLCVVSDF